MMTLDATVSPIITRLPGGGIEDYAVSVVYKTYHETFTLVDEMFKWCEKTIGPNNYATNRTWRRALNMFSFSREEDMIMFLLRWS